MSISGNILYAALNDTARNVRLDRDKKKQEYDRKGAKILKLRKKLGKLYEDLAMELVPATAEPLIQSYNKARRASQEEREQGIQQYQARLTINTEQQQTQQELIARIDTTLKELYKKEKEQETQVEEQIEKHGVYTRIEKEIAAQKEKLPGTQEAYNAAVKERDEKLVEYDKNPAILYLADKQRQRKKFNLIDKLMMWRKDVNWHENQEQIATLVEAPNLIKQTYVALEKIINHGENELLTITDQIEDKIGYTGTVEEIEEYEAQKEKHSVRLRVLINQQTTLTGKLDDLLNAHGSHYTSLINLIEGDIQGKKDEDLKKIGQGTKTQEDDQIIGEIIDLREQIQEEVQERDELHNQYSQLSTHYKNAIASRDAVKRGSSYRLEEDDMTDWKYTTTTKKRSSKSETTAMPDWDAIKSQVSKTRIKPKRVQQTSYRTSKSSRSRGGGGGRYGGGGAGYRDRQTWRSSSSSRSTTSFSSRGSSSRSGSRGGGR